MSVFDFLRRRRDLVASRRAAVDAQIKREAEDMQFEVNLATILDREFPLDRDDVDDLEDDEVDDLSDDTSEYSAVPVPPPIVYNQPPPFAYEPDQLARVRTFLRSLESPPETLRDYRMLARARGQSGPSFLIDLGTLAMIIRDTGGSNPSLSTVARPFTVAESLLFDGLTVLDDRGIPLAGSERRFKGGPQTLHPGDTLNATYSFTISEAA